MSDGRVTVHCAPLGDYDKPAIVASIGSTDHVLSGVGGVLSSVGGWHEVTRPPLPAETVRGELCVDKFQLDSIVEGGSSSAASLCIDSHLEEFLRQNPLRVTQVTEADYKLTPWPKTVDDRLESLEAEVKALRELMRRLEDGK